MTRFACALLVDDRGWVLLQERDDRAPIAPLKWGMPGGHVEDGESFEDAAYRELEEETGIRLEHGHLFLWRDEELGFPEGGPHRFHVYAARVQGVTDADVVVGEGRQMVFVDPAAVPDLDLADSARHFVLAFLESSTYRRLAGFSA